jgi:outer membrane immunogenic protein
MKRLIPFAVLLAGAGAAHAADLRPRAAAAPPLPPPAPLFSGFYVGAHAGALGFVDRAYAIHAPTGSVLAHRTAHGGSVVGGVHAGYDWRVGPLVLGLVGDASGARAVNGAIDPFGVAIRNEVDAQGSLRGRVGYSFDRLLIYATGGLQLANVRHDYANAFGSQTRHHLTGQPTVGVGAEYAFSDRWSGRIEYRVGSVGTRREDIAVAPGLAARHGAGTGALTVGLSYRFGE